MGSQWKNYVTNTPNPPPEPDWKLLLMKILRCFGHLHDDWYEQYWHKFGVTREEGRRIVEEYESYQTKKDKIKNG